MRGQFLVRMRSELAKYEIIETGELPDHLTHVLPVLALMPEDEAQQFSHACVFPALHKMQVSLDKNQSPYRHLIRCLVEVLEQEYGISEPWGRKRRQDSTKHSRLPWAKWSSPTWQRRPAPFVSDA